MEGVCMKSKATRKVKKQEPVLIGAVHALKRLETEESRQYTRLKKAEASGRDPFEIKVARDAWLKTSEGLRRFDILIEAARRETGELIPRRDVETWLANLASWLHFALRDATGDSDKGYKAMARALRGYVGTPDHGKPANHGAPVPAWILRALQAEGVWRDPEEQLLAWRRLYHVDQAATLYPDDPKKFSAHVAAAMMKDTEELRQSYERD
jgi:hypothetical protein